MSTARLWRRARQKPERREANADKLKEQEEKLKREKEKKESGNKGGEVDPDADDEDEARRRRQKMLVVTSRDDRARKARMTALNRVREMCLREMAGTDGKNKGKERQEKMMMEKMIKVLDMQVSSVDKESANKKKPLERQLEVLRMERDHASQQGIATSDTVQEKIMSYEHRINQVELQRQLEHVPIQAKRTLTQIKYIHLNHEHESERNYEHVRCKQRLVQLMRQKLHHQMEMKIQQVQFQIEQFSRQRDRLIVGTADHDRVSHQVQALVAKKKRLQATLQKQSSKFDKLNNQIGVGRLTSFW
eukprot:Sspe_Gene.8351::Locus_2846_Transcript_1_1_Confidence_1.000_Length_5194::g.8351::m.8351